METVCGAEVLPYVLKIAGGLNMIKVKLFATLREGRANEIDFKFFPGINGRFILEKLNIPEKQVAIFLVNGRDYSLDEPLSDGDVIAIFPPVGGG
ncbi:MAG: sulfur-carrier protein [Thermodesulfobacterium sp.]|nr:sulfur-carrier protein [Thermodesulfobacterium sp.]